MTALSDSNDHAPSRLRTSLAIAAGFFTVVVASLGTDQALHVLGVYPPWGRPMFETSLNALALSYRVVFTIVGGYVTARLAADASGRAVAILAGIGLAMATLGAIGSIPLGLGPAWYPIAIAVTAVPCTLLGGRFAGRTRGRG